MPTPKALTATCHCRSVHFTLTIPPSSLPLKAHICNCTICRTTHGALASFHAPLPTGIEAEFITPSTPDSMTGYRHANAQSTRYFCSKCGCNIADREKPWGEGGVWNISVSIFGLDQNQKQDVWVIDEHYFVESTRDGGLAALLPRIGERHIKTWHTQPGGGLDTAASDETISVPEENKRNESLQAKCHCGGVSFTISRPREDFIFSPESKGWIHHSDNTKWLALLDVCIDCRLLAGSHVIGFMFVPRDHISPVLPDDLLVGTSRGYASSKGVYRTFCGKCGAMVFCSCLTRPAILDIATGILRAEEGVMHNDWAVWRTSRLGFVKDLMEYDRSFAEALTEGLQNWGREMHGEVRDLDIGSETGTQDNTDNE